MDSITVITHHFEVKVEQGVSKQIYIYDHKRVMTVGVLWATTSGMTVKDSNNVELCKMPVIKQTEIYTDYKSVDINGVDCIKVTFKNYLHNVEDKQLVTDIINIIEPIYGDISNLSLAIPIDCIDACNIVDCSQAFIKFLVEKQGFLNLNHKMQEYTIWLDITPHFYEDTEYKHNKYNIGSLSKLERSRTRSCVCFNALLYST